MEKNKVEFTGTIERLKSVNTKSATSMATLLLKVGQDKFKCVAFKNVGETTSRSGNQEQQPYL
jgi:hypothetical protein